MTVIDSDWHIHSHNSCDQAAMPLTELVAGTAARGITDYGVTDHVNTPYNLPDIARCREEWLALPPSPRFHFGVEASVVSRWEIEEIAAGRVEDPVWGIRQGGEPGCELAIAIDEATMAEYGIEYVVGGAHWPMYVPCERRAVIRDYHRQYMFLATHPLVNIVAHPWWWQGHWKEDDGRYLTGPWFDDFDIIPESMHDEFAAALRENGKAAEINIHANLCNPFYPAAWKRRYVDYLADLFARGVTLSLATDCHWPTYQAEFEEAAELLTAAGITGPFWRLPPRP